MSEADENESVRLLRACKAGDSSAFSALVTLHHARIYNLAFNYVKDEEEAKDLTQDIFITLSRNLFSLREEEKFAAWLYQLALNHCRNRYKKLQRRGFFSSTSIDDPERPLQLSSGKTPEELLAGRDSDRLVREAIAGLSANEKEIILLRDIEGLAYEEISVIFDVPLGTVKSRLNRARLALKDKLKRLIER